jgi:ubiquinol oxidase
VAPAFNEEQMNAVTVAHREVQTMSDKAALVAVKLLRFGLNVATGYKHKQGAMTEEKYMIRNVFLESVAGVPGMVAGMIRHLNSMRRMKRDNGW